MARFEAPHTIRVGDGTARGARRFSSTPVAAPSDAAATEGLPRSTTSTSSGMMDVDFLPEHLLIVGGSYVGLEFAQMYRRFGSRGDGRRDGAAADRARRCRSVAGASRPSSKREGIAVRLEAECIRRRERKRRRIGIVMHVHCEQGAARDRRLAPARWPSGASRTPTTWAAIGPAWRPTRAASSRSTTSSPTNVAGIWALGDVNGRGAFTHTVLQRLRDRGGKPASTTTRAASPIAFPSTRCSPTRRSRVPG